MLCLFALFLCDPLTGKDRISYNSRRYLWSSVWTHIREFLTILEDISVWTHVRIDCLWLVILNRDYYLQGVLFALPDCAKTPTDLVRLWQHEAARVYRDKLVDEKDLESYDKLLKDVVKKSFEVKRGIIYLTWHDLILFPSLSNSSWEQKITKMFMIYWNILNLFFILFCILLLYY